MIVILMGVAGAGKTTVGQLLADRLGYRFADADDFHPAANVEKMRLGMALSDADRAPWLFALRAAVGNWVKAGEDVVLACSALKASYRDELVGEPGASSPSGGAATVERTANIRFVYLRGSPELIAERLAHRTRHFMSNNLLDSQFAALEEPEGAIVVDITPRPVEIAELIASRLGRD